MLAVGLADWALDGLTTALEGLRGLLGRADLADLARKGEQDLRARGRLALDRLATVPPAHVETLARHAAARHARRDERDERDEHGDA
nr:hypothetical protein [Streptomyces taklimakanensis]